MSERPSLITFRDLLDAADLVTSLAGSDDESPAVEDAFVAAIVRLRDAAEAARPYVKQIPVEQDDKRVCGRCRRAWGSCLVPPPDGYFAAFNTQTGKYHHVSPDGHRGRFGFTACGLDACGTEWKWLALA